MKNMIKKMKVGAMSTKRNIAGSVAAGTATSMVITAASAIHADAAEIDTSPLINMLQSVFNAVLSITTPLAVVSLAILFLLKLITKDERRAAELSGWMKRIAISWIIIFSLDKIKDVIIGFTGDGAVDFTTE